jgi:predicted ATPase/class 3 adenylate cyclase/Tfp pilus assembly protein PilF
VAPLPMGTVTFLFTDIEGSTRLWERHPEVMEPALRRHEALAAAILPQHGGALVKHRGEGDSLFAVFAHASDAVTAAAALQRSLHVEPWPETIPLRVRMALHTGDAVARDGDYFGPAVNRCARLRGAAHGGQVLLSAATQELVRDQLPAGVSLQDLGECRLKDLARPERVFQLLHPDLPGDFPALHSLDARPHNLPVQRTALVGRERDVEAVRQLVLRDDIGLVTLTGPGGAGKTRLALQVAADLLDDYPDGAFFVEPAPIREPDLVAATIAHALGMRETGGRPLLDELKGALRDKQLLLLLDNFEQVVDAAVVVAELLRAAPQLKILVTSRAVLHLQDEHEYAVPALALPDWRHPPPLPILTQYAAVELFVQRGRAVKPDFAVTNENAPAVAEICSRLDGLPLAIELAAARLKLFSPALLLARLESRLKLLTGGARDLPARQQTLHDTIAWSYGLLTETEKALFTRLSVFVGGFTLEAAEAVATLEGDLAAEMVDQLTSLMGKSLVRQTEAADGGLRFTILETIGEYAAHRLAVSEEEETVRRRHAEFFLALAGEASPRLQRVDGAKWRRQFEEEHDNIRSVLQWAVARGEAELALRLGARLMRFWIGHGAVTEGRSRLDAILALPGAAAHPMLRARALQAAGRLALEQDHATEAIRMLEESLAIARAQDDTETAARALNDLASMADIRRETERARALYQEALFLCRKHGLHDPAIPVLNNLGLNALARKDYQEARTLLQESKALAEKLGNEQGIAITLTNLGMVALWQGDPAVARPLLAEGLSRKRALRTEKGTVWNLEGLAGVAVLQGNYRRAARLFGGAEAVRAAADAAVVSNEPELLQGLIGLARDAVGEAVFTAEWGEGQRMSLDQLLDYALQAEADP